MKNIAERLENVHVRIRAAERRFGRDPGAVSLVAVSKTRTAAEIEAAADCGQEDFGENYVQEAQAKMADCRPGLIWHFIGPVQSNKTRDIAARFAWVHSLDRGKIARRLDAARPDALPPLNVCIQVNISGEDSKAGVAPGDAAALAVAVTSMPRLRLRGLMAMPAPCPDFEAQRAAFRRLRGLLEDLRRNGHELDTLSMGTSLDMEAAIAEGATMVRIGTAIFGPREA
ncbi:MAG: YggS family pyridoxal phosphate-dependent enzyme [Gammaproteobacteria bacterium]|jgi:pyridoxal phosphate enzyme (YggS family)